MSGSDDPLDVARDAADRAGKVLLRYFRDGVAARPKDARNGMPGEAAPLTYDLVSDADLESERVVLELLRQRRPHDAVMSEETRHEIVQADRLWIVDPLDGTNNFAHGIPHFAVSIGYLEQGQPRVGVVYNPVTGDRFIACAGRGATLNGRPITAASTERLDESLVGVGFYYDRGAMMQSTLAAIEEFFGRSIHGVRRMGTASLDLCYVASGRFGVFFEYELAPWDYAAGALLVTEAGGRITDGRGGSLKWDRTSIVASAPALHEAAIDIVRRHHPA